MIYVVACVASFAHIALKAFQQLNVVHDHYWWVPPISLMMAACEVTIVTSIVKAPDVGTVLALGVGGGAGALLAMWLHKKLRNRRANEQ